MLQLYLMRTLTRLGLIIKSDSKITVDYSNRRIRLVQKIIPLKTINFQRDNKVMDYFISANFAAILKYS